MSDRHQSGGHRSGHTWCTGHTICPEVTDYVPCHADPAKGYVHHGTVAFAHCGKAMFEVLKYFGIKDIGSNQPENLPYPTENPWA